MSRNLIVLWRINEALESEGSICDQSYGSQMKYIEKGDILYICATEHDELFLLGAIEVSGIRKTNDKEITKKYGLYKAYGKSIFGKFKMLPLYDDKWKLTFIGSVDHLNKGSNIGYQLQQHRILSNESAELLSSRFNNKNIKHESQFHYEGKLIEKNLTIHERNPNLKREALQKYGWACMICGLDFRKIGSRFKKCIELHHLDPIAEKAKSSPTKVSRVIIICPNCHRMIHHTDDPSNWRYLKKIIAET